MDVGPRKLWGGSAAKTIRPENLRKGAATARLCFWRLLILYPTKLAGRWGSLRSPASPACQCFSLGVNRTTSSCRNHRGCNTIEIVVKILGQNEFALNTANRSRMALMKSFLFCHTERT